MCADSRRPGAERVPIEENQPTPDFAATDENKNKLALSQIRSRGFQKGVSGPFLVLFSVLSFIEVRRGRQFITSPVPSILYRMRAKNPAGRKSPDRAGQFILDHQFHPTTTSGNPKWGLSQNRLRCLSSSCKTIVSGNLRKVSGIDLLGFLNVWR